MTRRMTCAVAAAWAVLWLAAGSARADLIDWSYSWVSSPHPVYGDGQPADGQGNPIGNAVYGVGFLDQSGQHLSESADIRLTSLSTFSGDLHNGPTSFTLTNKAYDPFVYLKDDASGASVKLTFHGVLNGYASTTAANVGLTFSDPTQSVVLGGNRYTITLGPYTSPGPFSFGGGNQTEGSLMAHMDVQPSSPATAPEPTSLVLAGLGLAGLGGAAWRRWRRGRITPAA